MTISNEEATGLVEYIERKVRDEAINQNKPGILDIINQWRSDIEIGRQVERKLTVRQSPGLDTIADVPRSRRTTSGEFVGKEEYEPTVQLDMLVGALGIAYLAPQMMAQRFVKAIEDFGGGDKDGENDPDVRLVDAGDSGEAKSVDLARISHMNIKQSCDKTAQISSLLREISDEGGLPKRKFSDNEGIS
jgi:hypothetical protein